MRKKAKSKVVQNPRYDKSMHGFLPKEAGEVDLVGKIFLRRRRKIDDDVGDPTLIAGLLFGLDWQGQDDDEMWECEINIKPTRRFIDKDVGIENIKGLNINQILCSGWGDRENYKEVIK